MLLSKGHIPIQCILFSCCKPCKSRQKSIKRYTVMHIFRQVLFGDGNQSNHQNFDPSLLSYKCWLIFIGMKQKNSKWPTQKNLIFQLRQFSIFFMKISWISPWVSRIDWCKGHWFCSTHMAVRLANVSSKTGKKCIFCVFRPFLSLCRPASRPHGLSKINALCINQSY